MLALALQATAAPPPAAYRGNLTMDMEFEPASLPATAADDGDLTVVAKRIYRARMTTNRDRATKERRCTLKRALGIAPFDAVLCDRLLTCMSRNPTRALVKTCMLALMTADVAALQAAAQRSR